LRRPHGSVCTLAAVSDEAKSFADENFETADWQGQPTRFTTDHRIAYQLCEQLDADGFSIGRA
jgi:hypothetical protein